MSENLPHKFPTNPQHGDRISDINGIVYQYDFNTDTWVESGVLKSPPLATITQDGLVSPELYRKLNLINILKQRGVNWDAFQLATSGDKKPYFYYFNSSDDLIRFVPEGTNRLRIEVDKSRLYSKLLSLCCVGPKGEKGIIGDTGDTGKPGAAEQKRHLTVNSDGSLHIETEVATPLETDISIRFYNIADQLLVELLLSLDDNITIIPGLADIESSSLSIDSENNTSNESVIIEGNITLTGDEEDLVGIYYKARQRGPKGKTGKDGTSFIEVIEDIFSDSDILSTEAIIAIRKSGVDDNLTFTKQDLFSKNIFSSIHGITDFPLGGVTNDQYFALRVNTDDCKDIGKFQFAPAELIIPDLDLPDWTPMCNCTDTFRYQIQRFDWHRIATDQVPFSIIQEPPPDDACCQEDFFWCPNQGDLCGIGGAPKAPSRVPIKSDTNSSGSGSSASSGGTGGGSTGSTPTPRPPFKNGFVACPLPDPNAIELNGRGKELGSMNGSGEFITESVITNRGKPDLYTAQITFEEPNTTFTINVDIQIGHDDGTFDGGAAFTVPVDQEDGVPSIEQLNSSCALHSATFVVPDKGAVSTLLPSPNQEAQHDAIQNGGNSIVRITYSGQTLIAGTVLDLFINVNDTLLDCCLPYALRITTTSTPPSADDDDEITGSGSVGSDNDDIVEESATPPANNPFIASPIEPFIQPIINAPDFDDDAMFNNNGVDLPVIPDYKWRPVAITRPVLINLAPQMDGMLIGETTKTLIINANFSDKIQIMTSPSINDPRSVVFPIDGDPATTQMEWNTGTLEFDRNGSYLVDGPLGPGFYFLQTNQFSASTKYIKLGVTVRTDTFAHGFLYISGDSIDDENPSSLAIVANGVDWTINQFAERITGFGSNWIKRINNGIEYPGDSFFQIVMDSDESLIRKLFSGNKFTVDDAFMSMVYNPFGCAILNIPETITSMIGDIVGGRNDQNCIELTPPLPNGNGGNGNGVEPLPQTATIEWDAMNAVISNDDAEIVAITITLHTSNGASLETAIPISVSYVEAGVFRLLDWDFFPDPNTLSFAMGSADGTQLTFNFTSLGTGTSGDVIVTLTNSEAVGFTSATYTLVGSDA